MSINISSFSPQSSGGGGIFVLKCVEASYISNGRRKTFSAPYGGVVYVYAADSVFGIESIDEITSTMAANAYMVGSTGNNVYVYSIPFGSYCTLRCETNSIEYKLHKYELIQS